MITKFGPLYMRYDVACLKSERAIVVQEKNNSNKVVPMNDQFKGQIFVEGLDKEANNGA